MTLSDRLDELRQALPGCTLVSFGDLSTGLALRTSASRPFKQEQLDDILGQAARCFALSDLVNEGNELILVATQNAVQIHVRSLAGNSDILCCVCEDAPDVAFVVQSAQKILTDMSRAA